MHMRLFEGLTYEQISELVNMKKSTVGMKIMRCKKKIASKLSFYLNLEGDKENEKRLERNKK